MACVGSSVNLCSLVGWAAAEVEGDGVIVEADRIDSGIIRFKVGSVVIWRSNFTADILLNLIRTLAPASDWRCDDVVRKKEISNLVSSTRRYRAPSSTSFDPVPFHSQGRPQVNQSNVQRKSLISIFWRIRYLLLRMSYLVMAGLTTETDNRHECHPRLLGRTRLFRDRFHGNGRTRGRFRSSGEEGLCDRCREVRFSCKSTPPSLISSSLPAMDQKETKKKVESR